jgi:hypothetical protein
MRPQGWRWWTAALVLAGAVGVWMSAAIASGRPILARRWGLLLALAVWAAAWVVGLAAALRIPKTWTLGVVVAIGVALRLAAVAGPPTTSDDLYRYSWDARVQAAGVDPYAHAPLAQQLGGVRDAWLFPDPAGCAALHRPPGCTRINRPDQRTIYPPVAEAWFAAVGRVAGTAAPHKAWQLAGLATEFVVLALLPVALRRHGRDPRWTALYALSPSPVLEVVNNGHVDGLAVAFLVGAVAVAVAPRAGPSRLTGWQRDVAAGLLLGGAALVKLYPVLLVVALVGSGGERRLRAVLRAAVAAGVLAAVTYLPHIVAVGPRVLGYIPGYLKEEHYRNGGRFLVAGALHLPGAVTSVGAVLIVAVWVLWRRPPVPVGGAALLGALLLATSPVQPWYAVSLLALATVAARPRWSLVVVCGYPYFFAVILADRHMIGIGRVGYGAALAVVAVLGAVAHRLEPARPREVRGGGEERAVSGHVPSTDRYQATPVAFVGERPE